jgi:hypothetical protein
MDWQSCWTTSILPKTYHMLWGQPTCLGCILGARFTRVRAKEEKMNNHILNLRNKRNKILAAALVLALVSTACGANLRLPVNKIETGPTQSKDIQVPVPAESPEGIELSLEFVAGEMNLSPAEQAGTGGYLAEGTAVFNAVEFEPVLESNGSTYILRSGLLEGKGIPLPKDDFKNEWDLQLSDTPMSLTIQAGAYDANFELGGLSIENLLISDGGANFKGRFSEPNHVQMSTFIYNTGASTLDLSGLANANFDQMKFDSGPGDYRLSFDGQLQHDASVVIESGASTVTIVIPQQANAQVTFDGGLSSVNAPGWEVDGQVYTHSGSGPTLTITVTMGFGTLNLEIG